jgi:hypothetical protein
VAATSPYYRHILDRLLIKPEFHLYLQGSDISKKFVKKKELGQE